MRAIFWALFIFCISLAGGILNEMAIFQTSVYTNDPWLNQTKLAAEDQYTYNNFESSDSNFFKDTIRALSIFGKVVGGSIIVAPIIHSLFNLDWSYSLLLALPAYFIYIVAIVQIFTGKNLEGQR